jgi:hypothetical protein
MNENSSACRDDLGVHLIGDISLTALVNEIMARFKKYETFDTIYTEVVVPNVCTCSRAIVLDRAVGGIVRALTGAPTNMPSQEEDPVAYLTFMEVLSSFKRRILFMDIIWVSGFWPKWNQWRLRQ